MGKAYVPPRGILASPLKARVPAAQSTGAGRLPCHAFVTHTCGRRDTRGVSAPHCDDAHTRRAVTAELAARPRGSSSWRVWPRAGGPACGAPGRGWGGGQHGIPPTSPCRRPRPRACSAAAFGCTPSGRSPACRGWPPPTAPSVSVHDWGCSRGGHAATRSRARSRNLARPAWTTAAARRCQLRRGHCSCAGAACGRQAHFCCPRRCFADTRALRRHPGGPRGHAGAAA